MNCLLKRFIFAEQVLNNYDLYNGTDRENSFKMNLKSDFLPKNQKIFTLPYFLIPINKDLILYKESEKQFFDNNLFFLKDGKTFYPFFVHPETVEFFVSWLDGKYEFIDVDKSIYKATPTSSYRSLLVTNTKINVKFIVKVSLFDNVANGARHIDWSSASGQYSSSQIVCKCINGENRTTLASNMSMREYIGMSFLFHFIDNFIYPCIKYVTYEKIISESRAKSFLMAKYQEMKEAYKVCKS